MSEMKQIIDCITEIHGEIVQINNKIGQMDTKIGQMDAKINQMDAKINQMDTRIDQMDAKINQMDAKINQMDEKINQMDTRIDQMDTRIDQMDTRMNQMEEKMEKGFKQFDEKLSLVEFGLEAEIQKVYETVIDNQSNIRLLKAQQTNYQIDGTARQQVAEVKERVDVVEHVVQSHSDAIHILQDAIA